jgi:hypothetical protein
MIVDDPSLAELPILVVGRQVPTQLSTAATMARNADA